MVPYDSLLLPDQLWPYRSSFGDPWISDMFAGISPAYGGDLATEMADALFPYAKPEKTPTMPDQGSGGFTEETAAAKQIGRGLPPTRRVAKRKSRASKHRLTTFIIADALNFRQMVQQVTGANTDGETRIRDEAAEWGSDGGGFQTLDVSPFAPMVVQPTQEANGVREVAARNYFDSYSSFPTLESWKAV